MKLARKKCAKEQNQFVIKIVKVAHGINEVYRMKLIKRLFCRHRNNDVVCLHCTHGPNANEIRHLEIQLKCNNCGKYHFRYIYNLDKCEAFISKHKDKFWSSNCKPVL